MKCRPPINARCLKAALVLCLPALINSCALAPFATVGGAAGISAGAYTASHPDSIKRTATAIGKSVKDITPEQEYYIGRSVAATVLKHYPPYADQRANAYINLLGQSLAQASDRPETFGGYHFLILDSQEINAFAAPGGLILITRGMLSLCRSEDEAAAVLAHEIGHVENNHGLSVIQESRILSALGILASEGSKVLSGGLLAPLVEAFEGSVGDIAFTLMHSGYSRELERQADESAVVLLRRVGYDPGGLVMMLQEMDERMAPSDSGYAKTHPDPKERIQFIENIIGVASPFPVPQEREERFTRFIGEV
jgi:predicted Zn-dependent protease